MLKNIHRFIRNYGKDCLGLAAIVGITLVLLTIRYISYFAIM